MATLEQATPAVDQLHSAEAKNTQASNTLFEMMKSSGALIRDLVGAFFKGCAASNCIDGSAAGNPRLASEVLSGAKR